MTLTVGVLGLPSASAAGSSSATSQITYYNANYAGNFYRSTSPIVSDAVYGVSQTPESDGSVQLTAGPYAQYTDSGFSLYEGTLGDLTAIMVQGQGQYGLNLWLDTNNDGDFFEWAPSTVSQAAYMTGLGGDRYLSDTQASNPSNGALVVNSATQFYLQGVASPPNGVFNYTLGDLQNGALSSLGVTPDTRVAIWIGITGTAGGAAATATIDSVQLAPPTVAVTGSCTALDGTQVTVGADTFYCGYDAFPTVQEGVDAVAAGGTVDVAAGTYTEQVTIDKALTLSGAGQGQTFIDLPGSPTTVATQIGSHAPEATVYGIAVIAPASGVTISNLTVDGESSTNGLDGCSGNHLAGIAFQDASGTVSGVSLPDWAPQTGVGCGGAAGVQVEAGTGTAQVAVAGTSVSGYGKSGIFAGGAGATLAATGDTVTGTPTGSVATNGIEIDYGAAGSVQGSTVTGNDYTGTPNATDPQADYAAGVLLYGDGASAATVSGNTLTDNQIGIESVASGVTADDNTIRETGAGIADSVGVYAVPCDTYCTGVGVATGGTSQVTLRHNAISGIPASYLSDSNPTVVSAGIWVGNTGAADATGAMTAQIADNAVSGGFFGVLVAPNSAGTTATIQGNQVSGFERTGIDAGSFAMGGETVDATITGNTVTGPGPGNADPWASNGIEVANGATGSVTGNHVSGMIYTGKDTEATGVIVFESSDVQVSGNTVQDSQLGIAVESGGYSSDSANWTMQDDEVTDNTIGFDATYLAPGVLSGETAETWGIWVASYHDGASVAADITGNLLDGTGATAGGVPADGIQVGDSAAGGAAGDVSATIAGNIVTGWTDGIADVGTTDGTFSSVAHLNDLSGNTDAGLGNLTGGSSGTTAVASLDATQNWWGSADGPQSTANTYDVASQGVAVVGDVAAAPWLTTAPAQAATSGSSFAPVTDTTSGAQFSSIEAAVDAAAQGDTITAAAGTYSEAVSIETADLTLDGAGHGVDARTRSGAESVITGAGAADVTIRADGVTLDGFTLQGPVSQGTAAVVMIGGNTTETIENNIIDDPGRAVSYNTSDTTFLQNNVVESATTGDGIQENSGAVQDVTIKDNAFAGGTNNNADITFLGTSAAHNQDVQITGNTSMDPGSFIALFQTDGATVTDNRVAGAAGAAIYIGGADTDVTVQHNSLVATSSSPAYAVVVSNAYKDGPNADVAVNGNSLYGLSVGSGAYTGGSVDATDDWWGSKSGPTGVTQGDVDAAPWIQALSISPALRQADVGSPLQWSASMLDSTGTAITDPAFAVSFSAAGTAACQNETPSTPQPLASAAVTFGCTPTTAGDLTVTGSVSLDGTPTTLSGTAGLTAALPHAPTGGGAGVTQTGSASDGNLSSQVTVQGGTTTIDVDAGHLAQNLGGMSGSVVTFTSDTTTTDLDITGDAAENLTQNGDGISIETPGGAYTLPAGSIDMTQLEQLLGVSEASDITLTISVTPGSASDTTEIAQGIPSGSIVADPVTFTITASVNGQSQTIETFTGAVPRSFDLGSPPDPSDTTGIVLVNGVPEHAWTVFSGTTATIYSYTDSTYAVVTNQVSFHDIAGLPQEDAIQALADKLVIAGTTPTTFDPQGGVTRAEFAAFAVRALGLWNLGGDVHFSDVASSSWAAPVIAAAAAESFIQGFPDGTFRPQAQITNVQMAVIVGRIMGFLHIGAGTASVAPSDQASIPAWAAPDVALVLSQGVMTTQSGGAFAPNATTTRAQAAQIIWNLMQKAGID